MTEEQTLRRLRLCMDFLERAADMLSIVDGMEGTEEQLGLVLMEVEMQMQELASVG